MKFLVNDKDFDFTSLEINLPVKISDFFEKALTFFLADGELIVSLIINDIEINLGEIETTTDTTINEEDTISIKTEKSSKLVLESLEIAIQKSTELIENCDNIATNIRINQKQGSEYYIQFFVETINELNNILQHSLEILAIDIQNISVEKQEFPEIIEGLNDILKEMFSAQQNEDKVLIADLIEYEVPEKIKNLQDVFKQIKTQGEKNLQNIN